MQPGSPYHLIEAVGSCQVGSVWSAIDPQGRSLMVALLDSNVATDQRWREAFQEAANALVQAGEPGYLYADFASSSPWVAYAAENGIGAERVFLALGMDFRAVPPDGAGPLDYTPIEPTTQVVPPAAQGTPATQGVPDTPAQEQPLPPAVVDTATPAEALPTTVFPPVQPGPPAAESTQPNGVPDAAPQPVPNGQVPSPGPAPAEPVEDAEATQPTQRMQTPPATVQPWTEPARPQSAPPVPPQPQPQPAPPPVGPIAPQPISGSPYPVSGAPQPTSGAPRPTSAAPMPVSGTPMSPAFDQPLSPAYGAPAYGPRPPQGPAPYDPYAPVAPPAPRRSRTGMWIGIAVAVLVLIAGGGGVYAWTASGGTPTTPDRTDAATVAPLPTATPLSPGVEPPEDGNWNTSWPKFGNGDKVRRLSLEGVGFEFTVPADWDCQPAGTGEGFVEYKCGTSPASDDIGGELIVRECPQPCDDDRRIAMRKAEEAWGLRWKRGSRLSAFAETNEIDGQARYGLVIVAYWRSAPDEAIDRQLVFRMTAPLNQADVLRKISNSVRVGALF